MCSQSRPWLSQALAPTENEAKVTIFGKFNFVCFHQFALCCYLDCLWPDLNLLERLKERQKEMHLLKILIVQRKMRPDNVWNILNTLNYPWVSYSVLESTVAIINSNIPLVHLGSGNVQLKYKNLWYESAIKKTLWYESAIQAIAMAMNANGPPYDMSLQCKQRRCQGRQRWEPMLVCRQFHFGWRPRMLLRTLWLWLWWVI